MTINSQEKGKRAERDLANWLKTRGYPEAARAVKTGDRFTRDGGDLILQHESFRLVVEVKHHAGGLSDLQVVSYGLKLNTQVVQSRGNLGILVERRDRVSDPGRWWAHIHARSFARIEMQDTFSMTTILGVSGWNPVRVQLDYLLAALRRAGLADPVRPMLSLAPSAPDGSATDAATANTIGGA
jgi:hypothetical protein